MSLMIMKRSGEGILHGGWVLQYITTLEWCITGLRAHPTLDRCVRKQTFYYVIHHVACVQPWTIKLTFIGNMHAYADAFVA